ncbi:hypothetical protein D5086_025941 [Populus alba]|uniref:Uncharacterized protein n=1 Tax=Populus alba TaxID=43335 RepID=A0ACC4B0J2_POPAL
MALQSCWCIMRTIARAGCKGGGGALIILMFGGDNEIGLFEGERLDNIENANSDSRRSAYEHHHLITAGRERDLSLVRSCAREGRLSSGRR